MSSSSDGLQIPDGHSSFSSRDRPEEATALEMVETVVLLITGTVVGATMLPGFTLCIPVLATAAIVVLLPLVALAVLVALVGAIVTAPYLLVRVAVGTVRARRAARGSVTVPMPATDM